MPPGADREVHGRSRNIHFIKEHLAHAMVIMLAGVNDLFTDPPRTAGVVQRLDRPTHDGRFDKLGPRSDHGENVQTFPAVHHRSLTL